MEVLFYCAFCFEAAKKANASCISSRGLCIPFMAGTARRALSLLGAGSQAPPASSCETCSVPP